VSGTTATAAIQVTVSNGRPVVAVVTDSVNIGNLDIHLHGGASWLYGIFVKIFSGQIKDAINKALTNAITQNINNGLNKVLATMPITQAINKEIDLDFSFLSNPEISSSDLTTLEKGEFYITAKPGECPLSVCAQRSMPDTSTSQELQIFVSDYVVNSISYVLFTLGKLVLKVTPKDIPSYSPVRLNTTDFKFIIPALYARYPNMAMVLELYSTQPPTAIFTSNGAAVSAIGDLTVYVQDANGSLIDAFTLNGSIATQGVALLAGETLYGNLTYLKGDFTLHDSNIGPVNPTLFDSLLNLLFSSGVVPAVNALMKQGFQLPTVKGLTFQNPSLGFGTGYVYVSTDVQFTPPVELLA